MNLELQVRLLRRTIVIMVLAYAFVAGLHTVTDPDTGWQLASGRYLLEHRQIPSTDVFSYTARGRPWIYPPLAEIFLYGIYLLGGFAGLSLLNALACSGVVGIALWGEGGTTAAILAVFGVPQIASRTAPRADLFTSLLFAVLLALLWKHFRGRPAPLWLMPIIFLFWANTHLGFVSGLALIAVCMAAEWLNAAFPDRREGAMLRLRRAVPWFLACVPATLSNPWGWRIYQALLQQEHQLGVHENLIAEWRHIPITWSALSQALQWRNPHSSQWWLLVAVSVAALIALKQKALGPAMLLLGSAYLSTRNLRFQALFAIVVIVVATPFLENLLPSWKPVVTSARRRLAELRRQRLASACTILILGLAIGLTGIRMFDLLSQRAYISAGDVALFGTGLSSWYPERAADFIIRERLPGNIFHDYNLGGYWLFRLGNHYPDYIDGRALPFADIIFQQRKLLKAAPDSLDWEQEAALRGINTAVFGLARYWGLGTAPLASFCASQNWKPVYLDEVSVVFVRNTADNAGIIRRLGIDCATAPLGNADRVAASGFPRGRAEMFNYYANVGSVLFKLSRYTEAERMLTRALQMFPEEPFLHHTMGQLYEVTNRIGDAEREYLTSARLSPTDANWYSLGRLYSSEHLYPEAIRALENAAELSDRPSGYYVSLGMLRLAAGQPLDALNAFDAATGASEYSSPDAKIEIETSVAAGRARAWASLGNLTRAVGFEQEALEMSPADSNLWNTLAELYRAQGRADLEQQGRRRAQTQGSSPQ